MTDVVTRKVCLLGFGNVGRRLCELVARMDDELARRHGLRLRFVAVGTGSHGSIAGGAGLSAAEVLEIAGASPTTLFPEPSRPGAELIAAGGADVLVEATPLDPHGGRAAIAHIEAALAAGADVVTVNKGPIAWDYRRLAALATARERRLLFEGTVMDGCPVFDLFRSCLPGCRLLGFDAVFNSTTNFILDAMGEGVGYADALAQVQAAGYAETDPTHDIDGHDAAAKTAALASVLMDTAITPDDVAKDTIRGVTAERVAAVRAAGCRLRVVCSAGQRGEAIAEPGAAADSGTAATAAAGGDLSPDGSGEPREPAARRVRPPVVRLTELEPDHPLYAAGGSTLSVLLHTDLMGTVQVAEHGALPEQTAYAVYADLLSLHEGR